MVKRLEPFKLTRRVSPLQAFGNLFEFVLVSGGTADFDSLVAKPRDFAPAVLIEHLCSSALFLHDVYNSRL